MNKVLVIDTSIMCVYLQVPKMDDCGPSTDKWDYNRVSKKIEEEINARSTLVLPLATLIETGNHIAQASDKRYEIAEKLADIIIKAADAKEPWAAFSAQGVLWKEDGLKKLAVEWPKLAQSKISIGDATIKDVAEYYADSGCVVEILTGDEGLKSYQPMQKDVGEPRRRR